MTKTKSGVAVTIAVVAKMAGSNQRLSHNLRNNSQLIAEQIAGAIKASRNRNGATIAATNKAEATGNAAMADGTANATIAIPKIAAQPTAIGMTVMAMAGTANRAGGTISGMTATTAAMIGTTTAAMTLIATTAAMTTIAGTAAGATTVVMIGAVIATSIAIIIAGRAIITRQTATIVTADSASGFISDRVSIIRITG